MVKYNDDETATSSEFRVNRRDVVRSVGIIGVLAATGTIGSTAVSPDDEDAPPSPILGGEGNVLWYRTGDRDGREKFRDAIATPDGGVTTIGLAADNESTEAWQYGWDSTGDKKWTALQGDATLDSAFGGTRTATGGYALCGRTQSAAEEYDRFYVVETGPRGEELWTQRFHVKGCTDSQANDIVQTTDRGYVTAGIAADQAALAKLDPKGEIEWMNTYSGGQAIEAVSVIEADDGYVLGGTVTYGDNTREFLLLKTDATGREQWRQTYSAGKENRLTECIPTDDGYALVGTALSANAFTTDALFVRTDLNGSTVWTQTYGQEGEEYTADGITATKNGYAFVGTRSADVIGPLLWLGGLTESGDKVWTYSFGTDRPEIPQTITTTADGYIAVCGYRDSAERDDGSDGFVSKIELLNPAA